MKVNKQVREYANDQVKKYGLSNFKRYLSEAIHDLSTKDDAISNVNQLYFFVRVLFYLKHSH